MRVVVAQDQPVNSEALRQVFLGMGLECSAGDCVGHSDLLVRLAQNPADLVIVRAGSDEAATLNVIRQALPLTKAPILVMGPAADAQQILRYLQGGAREFLDEAQLQVNLETALEKFRQTGGIRYGTGVVAGVISATPGAGVTTVATNLAFTWAEAHPNRVALVELGRGAADLALTLDLQPRHTVADVHANWERLDATLLRQSMLAHPGGVQILAHKPETLAPEPLPPQAVRKSVILLRTLYEGSVLDLGHTVGEDQTEALRVCDAVILVARMDVPGLRQARRFLRLLGDRGVPRERIRLLANRYGQSGQVPWKKAEEAVGTTFAGHVTEDVGAANTAANQGQPLIKVAGGSLLGASKIKRCFMRLVDQLNERPSP